MNLFDRIKILCEEKDVSISRLEQETDLANGSIRKWSNAIPSGDRLAKVADYFNVTTDYLLGRDISATVAAHRTDGYGDGLPPEAQEELKNYIDYLKVKYKKKDNK